jgi:hypothetical protein
MNATCPSKIDVEKQRDVITSCDYGTCPTIKSENAINTMIVVKSDEKFQPVEARTSDSDDYCYESLENSTLGVQLL